MTGLGRREFITGALALGALAQPASAATQTILTGEWRCVLQQNFGTDEHIGGVLGLWRNGLYDWNSRFRTEQLPTRSLGNWSFDAQAQRVKLVARGGVARLVPGLKREENAWRAFATAKSDPATGDAMVLSFSEMGGFRFETPAVLGFERI